MTDKAAPKAKKAKDKEPKVTGPKLVDKDIKPGIGHNNAPNNGEKNPEAIKVLDEIIALENQKKSIGKAVGTLRNRLRTEFAILASSVSRELALRKLDPDVRVQVETNHEDFKRMVGYQPSLDFVNGVATQATQKAVQAQEQSNASHAQQPKHSVRDTEPNRAPAAPEEDGKRFSVAGDDDKAEAPEKHEHHHQQQAPEAPAVSNVIVREG